MPQLWRVSRTLLLATCVWPSQAYADGPLGPNRSKIRTSNYNVDLSAGPVLADSRTTALAGAYVAIAEGVDGNPSNPASPAVRLAFSRDWFDFDLGAGIYLPSTISGNDFFNTGQVLIVKDQSLENFFFLIPGITLQFGEWGIGYTLAYQSFKLQEALPGNPRGSSVHVMFATSHLELARMAFNQNFSFGVGLRIVQMALTEKGPIPGSPTLFNSTGAAPELGVLWQPKNLQLRVGAAFHFGMQTVTDPGPLTQTKGGDVVLGPPGGDVFYLPRHINVPWQFAMGAAFQLGPRPFNPHFYDPSVINKQLRRSIRERRAIRTAELQLLNADNSPKLAEARRRAALEQEADDRKLARFDMAVQTRLRARYISMSRRYLLISTEFDWTGVTEDSVGIESFLSQIVNRSGQTTTFSPRFGMETEPVANWVKMAWGFYAEPTRFETSYGRMHYTAGMTVRVLPWTLFGLYDPETWWRLRVAVDIAPRYLGWGIAVAPWH